LRQLHIFIVQKQSLLLYRGVGSAIGKILLLNEQEII